jgi:hypothetical protein
MVKDHGRPRTGQTTAVKAAETRAIIVRENAARSASAWARERDD